MEEEYLEKEIKKVEINLKALKKQLKIVKKKIAQKAAKMGQHPQTAVPMMQEERYHLYYSTKAMDKLAARNCM